MRRSQRKRSSVSTLLILAAIDMLTASLVCAVVLFLVLVGSDSNEISATPGPEMFNAPSMALIYFKKGSLGPELRCRSIGQVETTNYNDALLQSLLGDQPYSVQTCQIKGGEHQVAIDKSSTRALLEIYPGNGNPVRVVLTCDNIAAPLTILFGSATDMRGSCLENNTGPDVSFPEGVRIQFARQPDQPSPQIPPDDWEATEPPKRMPDGRQRFTLRSKKSAPGQALGVSAKIAEVLN